MGKQKESRGMKETRSWREERGEGGGEGKGSFFFNDTATTEIYTLSLHDALPIFNRSQSTCMPCRSPGITQKTEGDTSQLL